MKKLFPFFLLAFSFCSCLSTRQLGPMVDTAMRDTRAPAGSVEWLSVELDSAIDVTLSEYDQSVQTFIPAILFWKWHSTIDCEIDYNYRAEQLEAAIVKNAENLGLEASLDGKQVAISFEQIPGKFRYDKGGYAAIFIIAYSSGGVESIQPYPLSLEYEYVISEAGQDLRSGSFSIANSEIPLKNVWKSSKKFTRQYFESYNENVDIMGQLIVEDLMEELRELETN